MYARYDPMIVAIPPSARDGARGIRFSVIPFFHRRLYIPAKPRIRQDTEQEMTVRLIPI